MRSVVIISVLVAVVAADVSHLSTYNHNAPNSYVPPASGNPSGQNGYYQTQQLQSPAQYASQYDGVLSAPKLDTTYNQRQLQLQQYQSNSYQASAAREYTPVQTPTYQPTAYAAQPQSGYAAQAQQSVYTAQPQQSTYAAQQTAHQLPPIVTKHFYVHAAPEDPEEQAAPRYVPLGRAHKTYKVIFIKAPSYGSSARIIPVLPQNEEKTVVYVLSKKPDFNQEIQLPEQPVTEPTKPEVFFIKYKTQQEAENARQQIQAAYDSANTNIDSNVIQQGSSLFDVRSSTDEQSAASSSQQTGQYTAPSSQQTGQYTASSSQQTGQYTAPTNNQYDSGAYHPHYSASNNYAQSSLPNYLPPTRR